MPRTLPWLQSGATAQPKGKINTVAAKARPIPVSSDGSIVAPSRPPKRPRTTAPRLEDEDLATIEYMNSDDDLWIMVEDEFLTTAQIFTRSIHRKEYERLKAASKNASQISTIQQPVTGTSLTSKQTLLQREKAAKRQLQQSLLRREAIESPEEDEDAPGGWAISGLRTLMRTTTGSEASLGPKTKPLQSTSTNEDDLDALEGKYPNKAAPDASSLSANCLKIRPVSQKLLTMYDGNTGAKCVTKQSRMVTEEAGNLKPGEIGTLDFDDDFFSLVPTKKSKIKLRGKSMVGGERDMKTDLDCNQRILENPKVISDTLFFL